MAKKGKSAHTGRRRSEFLWGRLFVLLTIIGLIILNIIPIFQTVPELFKTEILVREIFLLDLKIIQRFLEMQNMAGSAEYL